MKYIMDDKHLVRNNCLSLIKLLAALQVMYGHLIYHLNLPGINNFFINKIISYYSGVPIFFIISGFLIWFSIERSSSYKAYLKKRFWRIYPELWLAVIIEILTILIFYNDWNTNQLILFTITQGTFFQFYTPASLRDYGCGTPNGTLWTICVMIQFYFVAGFIYKYLHRSKLTLWLVGIMVLVGCSAFGQLLFERFGDVILIKLYGQSIIKYFWLFYIGCFLAEFKSNLLLLSKTKWLFLFFGGLILHFFNLDINAGYGFFRSFLLTTALICFAYSYPQLAIRTDITYGIFLYHMIIVNVFITKNYIGNWLYAMTVLAITLGFAYFSTLLIGKRTG